MQEAGTLRELGRRLGELQGLLHRPADGLPRQARASSGNRLRDGVPNPSRKGGEGALAPWSPPGVAIRRGEWLSPPGVSSRGASETENGTREKELHEDPDDSAYSEQQLGKEVAPIR